MRTHRLIVAAAAGAVLLLDAGAGAYAADPTYPTGTFTLDRTSTYMLAPGGERLGTKPAVLVSLRDISDDETAPEDITVGIVAGDGGDGIACTAPYRPGATCPVPFTRTGTFTPQVLLTDEDDHTTTVTLPRVTVLSDLTAPVARVTMPRPRLRHRISAWRVIRGTAVDRGIGLRDVHVRVMQKRHGRWFYYRADTRQPWHKGLRSQARTWKLFSVSVDAVLVGSGRWRTPWIRGLTRGPLVVRVFADDWNINVFASRNLARTRLNRR